MRPDRRGFLGGLLALPFAACGTMPRPPRPATPALDAHVHVFGVGDDESGCHLSPQQRGHRNFRFLLKLLLLREDGHMDSTYVERLLAQRRDSPLQHLLLFAQDGRCTDGVRDLSRTHCYVPNEYVAAVCRRDPEHLHLCGSINPERRDALDEAEKCKALGARAVKVHPPMMDIDPATPAFRPFYRKLAELGLVVIVHTGTEHATPVERTEIGDPAKLEPALQEGCTVIAAHSGFGSALDGLDFFPSLQRLVRRYDRLYCDTAVLASAFRWRCMPRLLADPAVVARTLHASDWPFPSSATVFWNRLRLSELVRLVGEDNLLARDLLLKEALGQPAECATRGLEVLGIG